MMMNLYLNTKVYKIKTHKLKKYVKTTKYQIKYCNGPCKN